MSWEHSYTDEAYELAEQELYSWDNEALAKALGDYNYETFHGDNFRPARPHHKGFWDWKKLVKLPKDILVQACMDCIYEVYTCDNGGFAMWIDWEGFHTVTLPKG